MKNDNKLKGDKAENITAKWIQSNQGYKIVSRNYRTKFGEIDLIAKDGDTFVFIEVKFRSTTEYGQPIEAVTLKKQSNIIKCAMIFLQKEENSSARFDVAEVMEREGKYFIRYTENAFEWRAL